jgi:exonuclease III
MRLPAFLITCVIVIPLFLKLNFSIKTQNPTTHLNNRSLFLRFCKSRNEPSLQIYPRLDARRFALILLLAGDISLNPGPNFKLSSTNAQSLRNKLASLSTFITTETPDVLCITETWLKPNDTSAFLAEVTPAGYALHQKPRASRGGGVAILARKELNPTEIASPKYKSFELVSISCVIEKRKHNFACIYRPPHTPLSTFIKEFEDFLKICAILPTETIFCGDFNIPFNSTSNTTSKFKTLLDTWDLTQHVDFATHKFGNILDFIISASEPNIVTTVRSSGKFSDHFCLTAQLRMEAPVRNCSNLIKFRKFTKINSSKLCDDLVNSPLITCPLTSSTALYNQYHTTLTNLLDIHAPYQSKTCKHTPNKWINQRILEAKRTKRQLERIWRKCKSTYNRSKLNKFTHYFNRLVREEKNKHYTELIDSSSSNPKKLWKAVNQILHRSPESALPPSTSDQVLADEFSCYFSNKIQNIREKFPPITSTLNSDPEPASNPEQLSEFLPVSEDEVLKMIKSSPQKSCSLDPWPTFLVIEYINILITPITNIINYSLKEGEFPETFKHAIVSPLIKKPTLNKEDFKNYRPVSNLNYISKLLERVVASQIKNHMDKHNLHNSFQSAYRKLHSTESALLKINNDINLSLSRGKGSALVLLDMSAAFDTIDHDILLRRLPAWFGLTGNVLDWFVSYLFQRTQSIKIRDACSAKMPLLYGVPQGSVLGPLLFTSYSTPLSNIISSYDCSHHLYADDTQLYIELSPSTASSALNRLQDCLGAVKIWMTDNRLKLNPDKTEFMLFGDKLVQSKFSNLLPVNVLGETIFPSNKVKNLGVIFDSESSFSYHISQICRSCFYHIRDLGRIRRHLSRPVATLLANALVSSKLDYCNSLLIGLGKQNLKPLQRIQNILCRIVTRIPRLASTTAARKSLHWLPIESRIKFKINLLTFKALQSSQPAYLKAYLQPYSSTRGTRRSNPDLKILNTPFCNRKINPKTLHLSQTFFYTAPRLWNDLPIQTRTATKLGSFRRSLKSHLFSKAYPT